MAPIREVEAEVCATWVIPPRHQLYIEVSICMLKIHIAILSTEFL